MMKSISRQEYLGKILDLAVGTHSGNSNEAWAQYPTTNQRAQALLNIRLKAYAQDGNTQGVMDTKWALNQVLKQRSN